MSEPSTSRLYEYRNAIGETIRAALPKLRAVETLGSKFSVEDLTKRSIATPAVFVVLGDSSFSRGSNGCLNAIAKVAVFCVTKGREEEREATAFAIAEAVAQLANVKQMWGLTRIGPASKMSIDQILSDALDKKAVACVVTSFEQRVCGIGNELLREDGTVDDVLYFNGAEFEYAEEDPFDA